MAESLRQTILSDDLTIVGTGKPRPAQGLTEPRCRLSQERFRTRPALIEPGCIEGIAFAQAMLSRDPAARETHLETDANAPRASSSHKSRSDAELAQAGLPGAELDDLGAGTYRLAPQRRCEQSRRAPLDAASEVSLE
jgi:hypothetical protein